MEGALSLSLTHTHTERTGGAALDLEGAETAALKHFPSDRHKVRVITVEWPRPAAQQILEDLGFRSVLNPKP